MVEHFSIRHHFAGALWRISIATPAPTFFALASDRRREFLQAVLQAAAPHSLPDVDDLDIESIEVQLRRVANRPVAFLRIPPPYRCPDPQMIALVLNKEIRGDVRKSDLEGGTIEFFTLEEPPELPDRPLTFLCSTDVNGVHHNHGAGPIATVDEFCKRLSQIYRPPAWWHFWRRGSSPAAKKPRCPQCNARLTIGSQTECKKCQWLRYPSDRSRWERSGACPGCGFSYRFDGASCSHCGRQGNGTTFSSA